MARSDLFAAVLDKLNREDMADQALTWLKNATSRINQTLRVDEMITRVSNFAVTSRFMTVPSDFIAIRDMSFSNGGPLKYAPSSELADMLAATQCYGPSPKFYTIHGKEYEFAPWTNGLTYTVDFRYYAKIPVLPNDASTNWLLDDCPELYENAMLVFGHRNLLEFDTADRYETLVANQIIVLNQIAENRKYGPQSGALVRKLPAKMGGRRS